VKLAAFAFLGAALASGAETIITFATQGNVTSRVAVWSARACPPKAVSITVIYAIASYRGIPWMEPKTAQRLIEKKSIWGRIVRWTGFASAGGGALMTFDVIKASPQIQTAFVIGGALITVLLPLAQREVPQVDPTVGGPLMLSTDGCGETSFYAFPSSVTGFNEVLP
jgi:hypothetical protein